MAGFWLLPFPTIIFTWNETLLEDMVFSVIATFQVKFSSSKFVISLGMASLPAALPSNRISTDRPIRHCARRPKSTNLASAVSSPATTLSLNLGDAPTRGGHDSFWHLYAFPYGLAVLLHISHAVYHQEYSMSIFLMTTVTKNSCFLNSKGFRSLIWIIVLGSALL